MASQYTHDYSNFPHSVMEKIEFKDVDSSVIEAVNAFEEAMANDNYSHAKQIYKDNNLGSYIISAYHWNLAFENLRNTQIYAKTKGQQIHYIDSVNDIPDSPVHSDIFNIKVQR